MQLEIKKLGPINDSNIDFSSDITVIFGKSNEGKSYILKALYSSLCFLDKANEQEFFENFIIPTITEKLKAGVPIKGGSLEIEINLKELIKKFVESWYSRTISEADFSFSSFQSLLSKIDEQSKALEVEKNEYLSGVICPSSSYKVTVSYSKGRIIAKVDVQGSVTNESLCTANLSNFLVTSISNYISQKIFPNVIDVVGESEGIRTVRFLTYGRSSILYLINEPISVKITPLLPVPILISPSSFPRILRSPLFWITNGLNALRNEAVDDYTKRIFDKLNVKISYEDGRIKVSGYELNYASASFVELASFYLSTIDGKGGLLLIEEPETQLDVYKQVTMAILLYNLSKKFKIVLTTHSQILLFTLVIISYYSKFGMEEKLKELLAEYGDLEVRPNVTLSFYLVENGKICRKEDKEILGDAALFSDINEKLFEINAKLLVACEDRCK